MTERLPTFARNLTVKELGYTWISSEAWGWLPYHHGRWAHTKELGWIWTLNVSHIFKPGEVYWLRGVQLVGWGPLMPGETGTFSLTNLPQQFYEAYTTFAPYTEGATLITPSSLVERPKEPLRVAEFTAALPSPAFDASNLDAVRPVTQAGSTRIKPVVAGVTYQGDAPAIAAYQPVAAKPTRAPTPPPVVIVNSFPPAQDDTVVPVPVPYPVAVIHPLPLRRDRSGARSNDSPKSNKKWRSPAEQDLYWKIVGEEPRPAQQIRDLDDWAHRFPRTDYEADRLFYYLQAYNRLVPPQPAKVLEYAAPLLARDVRTAFDNDEMGRARVLTVLYVTTVSSGNIASPTASQYRTGRLAAEQLLRYLPEFFAAVRKPANLSEDLWVKSRADMEATARKTLAVLQERNIRAN